MYTFSLHCTHHDCGIDTEVTITDPASSLFFSLGGGATNASLETGIEADAVQGGGGKDVGGLGRVRPTRFGGGVLAQAGAFFGGSDSRRAQAHKHRQVDQVRAGPLGLPRHGWVSEGRPYFGLCQSAAQQGRQAVNWHARHAASESYSLFSISESVRLGPARLFELNISVVSFSCVLVSRSSVQAFRRSGLGLSLNLHLSLSPSESSFCCLTHRCFRIWYHRMSLRAARRSQT